MMLIVFVPQVFLWAGLFLRILCVSLPISLVKEVVHVILCCPINNAYRDCLCPVQDDILDMPNDLDSPLRFVHFVLENANC